MRGIGVSRSGYIEVLSMVVLKRCYMWFDCVERKYRVNHMFRVQEFLFKTDSRYPKDTGVTPWQTLADPGRP